jgi:hypothetical protein
LRGVDDAAPVDFLGSLRRLPLDGLDRVGGEQLALNGVLKRVGHDLAVGLAGPGRRWLAVKQGSGGVENAAHHLRSGERGNGPGVARQPSQDRGGVLGGLGAAGCVAGVLILP